MKKTMLFSSALVALAMLASCQKEQPIETPATATGVTEFTATIGQPTKTAIGPDGKITWTEGDEITVTDAASHSAVYVAASDGASTKFNLRSDQTAVGAGPYTATYGDITKQVYGKDGANCPLTAAETNTTNLHFSSPYAVLKITAESSGGELVKTVVVKYGNSSSILDCGDGETLTSDGKVFYVAVRPSTEAAALSISFYTADKMATKARNSEVILAAKDLLPVRFESLTWSEDTPTFKAVYNTTGTLTFYYDTDEHNEDVNTVYKGSDGTNYLFDDAKSQNQKWGYYDKYGSITNVKIDPSVAAYKDLTSTAYMFRSMSNANNISGAEYLDVSKVKDMSYMFQGFGSETLTDVPKVSGWNTGEVKDMSYMFKDYGSRNRTFNVVPDVSKWNTDNVNNMSYMFNNYGGLSESLNAVPDVSGWRKTGNVKKMSSLFKEYGKSSTVLDKVPDVSKWNTDKVEVMEYVFSLYGKVSPDLETAPDVSGWNVSKVEDMDYMFQNYGNGSVEFNFDLSNWNLANLPDDGGNNVFDFIAKKFDVDIPGVTSGNSNPNTKGRWYYGTGNNHIAPAKKSANPDDRWEFNPISAN